MLTLIGALDCIELSVFPGIQLGDDDKSPWIATPSQDLGATPASA